MQLSPLNCGVFFGLETHIDRVRPWATGDNVAYAMHEVESGGISFEPHSTGFNYQI